MNRLFAAFLISIFALSMAACDPTQHTKSEQQPSDSPSAAAGSPSAESDGISPMAGVGAGGVTPVQGAESVQGGGSNVGQAAKDKARSVGQTAPSSINQMTDDGN